MAVPLHIVEDISDETVRRVLKKTNSNLGSKKSGVFPREGRSLSGAWKIFWTCTCSLTTKRLQLSASMNALAN
jgi:hypothetical protein